MKKVTIITPPEYEGLVLESLGTAQVTQLVHLAGTEFEGLEAPTEHAVDYKELYQRVQTRLIEPLGLGGKEVERVTPDVEDLREFSRDPEGTIDSLIKEAESLINKIKTNQENVHIKNNAIISELEQKLAEAEDEASAAFQERLGLKVKLDSISALEPEELKNCFAAGIVKKDFMPQLNEYLKRYPETYSRTSELSKEENILFVFGNEESRKWIDSLFLVYDIKDIFDVLDPADVLLVLDPAKRKETIDKYNKNLKELETRSRSAMEADHEKRVAELKNIYESMIKENEALARAENEKFQEEQKASIGIIQYYSRVLRLYSNKRAPVLRGKVISVLQGFTPDNLIGKLQNAINEVETSIGEKLYVEIAEVDAEDHHAPVPEKDFGSETFQPLWILTRLRGWPSAVELNPGLISVLIFCLQFGLMFGDIGQGLVFLALGLALNGRFKEGMMKYLFALMIPMGIAAIIFGFMYDSIFLFEHEITHWMEHGLHWHGIFDDHHHLLYVETPFGFNYPIMPNPLKNTGELMNLIFMVGAIELVFGSLLGAYNKFKEKNYAGMIGQHGLGIGLFVTGLYLSASTIFTEGLNIMVVVAGFPFKLMMLGMGLGFIEPMVHSLMHGHGLGGMEAIGEGVGGLFMTFVEGLANMFSFLRIAAFAIAHVSLSGAGASLGNALNNPMAGMVVMNIIAMTFEFMASAVQSVRLLYYEFMAKFFHGGGARFRPFKIRAPKPVVE